MAIFVDSGDVKEITKFMEMGILRGVTTNPSILLKDGVKGGSSEVKKRIVEIAKVINPYPLSVEATTNEKGAMILQAKQFSQWADNIVIKITIHGPNGELGNLEVVQLLENKHNIRVNVTAMMSAQQCFLAAMAGATYVSLFAGRINDMGYNCIEEIKKTRKLLDEFNLKAKMIAASTREVLNVIEWLDAGAHVVTVSPNLLNKMIVHPYTKETVQQFLADAQKIEAFLSQKKIVETKVILPVKSHSSDFEFVNKPAK
jgi:transaldolase